MEPLSPQYSGKPLVKKELADNPFEQFRLWFDEAMVQKIREPHAMGLATVDSSGQPDLRSVLLKEFDSEGFIFYTNLESAKALQIEANNKVALLFLWKKLMRQVRIQGVAYKVDREKAAEYFKTRPRGSCLGAWASEQSREIPSREALDARYQEMEARFAGKAVPLPDFWGGYKVKPIKFEFWQGQDNRLSDRCLYELSSGVWTKKRLAP
ncbi:MAG: pyridoxamine 5'-phosphate oxidase [Bdellovibrionota bacterium]